MKNQDKIIIKIVSLSIISVFLIVYMSYMILGNNKTNNNISLLANLNITNNKLYSESFYNNVNNININSVRANIIVSNSYDNMIHVSIYGKDKSYSVESKNENLNINIDDKCNLICLNKKAHRIEVKIPENYDKELYINNKYGNIDIEEFKYTNMIINNEIGNVSIFDVSHVKLNVKYGDILINNADHAVINALTGNIKVLEVDSINATNTNGNIKIDVINESLKIKNKTGNIELNEIKLKDNSSIENGYGDITIKNPYKLTINAKTELGKVTKDEELDDISYDYTLTVRNKCGDIKIINYEK